MHNPVYGLTGGIASGKSTILAILQNLGVETLDTDQLARDVIENGTPGRCELEVVIGSHFFKKGVLNRPKLRAEIYTNPKLKAVVENVIHPHVNNQVTIWLSQPSQSLYRLLCSPLLIETNQHQILDGVIVVDVPESTQESRAVERDTDYSGQLKQIIQAQLSRKERLRHADFIIDNSRDIDSLNAQIYKLHEKLSNDR